MERTVIIDAQVNTGNSVEDLEKVAQGFDDVASASSKSNSQTQKQFDDLNKKIDKGGLSVRDYSKAIKEYTSIALAAGRTSPIGVEALNRAAQMKDELGDLKNEVTRLGADGRKLQASLQLGGTVVAGYQAFTGVTAMLGVENEGLLKTMTMLQAAQGTLQAIETVRLALEKESMLMIELRNAKTKVATALQWLFNAAMSANPMGLVVLAIGALIAGLGILVSKMGGVTVVFKAIGKVASSVFDGIVAGIDFAIDMYTKFLDIVTFGLFDINNSYKSYTKSLEDASAAEKKREENAIKERALIVQNILELKKKIKILDEEIKIIEKTKASVIARYDQEIRLAQASGKETYAIEKQKLADIIDFTEKEIQLKLKKYLATKALQQEESNFTKNLMGKDMAFVLDNNQEEIKANNVKVRELAELRKQVNDAKDTDAVLDATRNKENYDKWKENEEKKTAATLEANKIRTEKENEYLDTIAKLQDENFESTLSAQAIEERAVDAKYFALEEAAKNNAEQLAIVTEAKERELGAITKKYRDEENRLIKEANDIRIQKENEYLDTIAALEEQNFEKTLTDEEKELRAIDEKYFALEEAAKGNAEQLAIINEAKNKEINDSNQKYRTEDESRQKQINDFRTKALLDTLSTLSSLNELFGKKNEANAKKQFQINKAISIASALITTYQSATAAYASQIIPLDPSSVVRGAIAAGLAVASGLANVAKIASTQFGGSASASGGDSGGGGGTSLPTVDTSSTTFQFPTVGGNNNPQSNQQTFVSVTEINNVNNRVQVAEANATFG